MWIILYNINIISLSYVIKNLNLKRIRFDLKIEYSITKNPLEMLHLSDISELEFRYGRANYHSSTREKCNRGKVHHAKGAASLLKNKTQRNVIREKHFEDYNRSTVIIYHRWKLWDVLTVLYDRWNLIYQKYFASTNFKLHARRFDCYFPTFREISREKTFWNVKIALK